MGFYVLEIKFSLGLGMICPVSIHSIYLGSLSFSLLLKIPV